MNAREALKRISARCLDHPQRYAGGVHEMNGDIDAVNTAILQGEADAKELSAIKKRAEEVIANLHIIDDEDPILHISRNPRIEMIRYILNGKGEPK